MSNWKYFARWNSLVGCGGLCRTGSFRSFQQYRFLQASAFGVQVTNGRCKTNNVRTKGRLPASSDPIMLFRLASPIIFRTAESRTFTVFSMVPKYGDVEFKGVNKSSTSEDLKEDTAPEKAEELKPLLEKIKAALGDAVKDVRASSRLAVALPSSSPKRMSHLRVCAR